MSRLVASACGAVTGRASIRAIFEFGLGTGRPTATRPGVFWSAAARAWTLGRSAWPFGVRATTWKVPLKPAPKPSARRSYALRVVDDGGSWPASEDPSRSPSTGIARATMTTSAPAASGTRCRCTVTAQRGQKPSSFGSCGPSSASRRRSFFDSARIPISPSSAGTSVTAALATVATTSADARPTPLRKLTPSTSSPSSATMTVPPANSTARPDVFIARSQAALGSRPALSALRWRVTTNSE